MVPTRPGWPALPLSFALAYALLPACSTQGDFYRPERAASQREAGSVHLSVLAVAPWSRYASVLQPAFRLSADEALLKVVRDTSSGAERSTSSVGLGAEVRESPDDTGLPRAPLGSTWSSSYLPSSRTERPDAMLEYWAATALYQEVQLLNRAISDAAIPDGYRSYAVRLQLSLLPHRRNEPYDVYTTLSFFSPEDGAPQEDGAVTSDDPAARFAHAPPATALRSSPGKSRLPGNGPCVLPLVVTDNLEASFSSRTQEDLSQLGLSLLGLPGDFGAALQADLFQQQLQAQVAARDLNSLMTLARLSENSLRVRLGALQQSTARFAMVPRNHYVTLLLMVPEDAPPLVDLVARTVLVDVETGEELAGTSEETVHGLLAELRETHARPELGDDVLEELLLHVQRNDQRGYRARLSAVLGGEPEETLAHALWIDLVSLMIGSQFSSSRFELPGHGEWEILPDEFYDQTALLVDDGRSRSTVTIRGATFAERVALAVVLHVQNGERALSLPADLVQRSEGVLLLDFPSLRALGLDEAAKQSAFLTLRWSGEEVSFDVLYVPPPPPPPS